MRKKSSMRGRPGLFFVIILVIFLMVFFMTWKSMMTPTKKAEIKDVYSMNIHRPKPAKKPENAPHSDVNDVWRRAKMLSGEKIFDGPFNGKEEEFDVQKNTMKVPASNVDKGNVKSPLSALLHATQKPTVDKTVSQVYYRTPDEKLKVIGGRMDRFVHLDLKGAAPKLSYFKEIFPLFSRLGATGLLIEYEDTFPYAGALQNISAKDAYSREEIKQILDLANTNSLEVIPLIQTFGHMEYVLKSHEMKLLRETESTPQVIDITSESSYKIIQEMIQQILEAHPAIKYLHIGCDEVYELGKGKSADVIIKEKQTPERLFLKHVKKVARIVAGMSKEKVRPIIWDDELRKMPEEDIKSSDLPSVLDIMVWRYTKNISDVLDDAVWQKYGRLFKSVWAASSFKGATGPRQLFTEPQYHIINHFSWLDAFAKYGHIVNFKGIALTGWQRFDHFATLCELLPVAIPSLAVCLATLRNGGFDEKIHKTTSTILGCSGMTEMEFPRLLRKEKKAVVSQDCSFPGHMIYYGVQQLWGFKQFAEIDRISGWLSDYQISHGYTNPGQMKALSMNLFALNSNLIQTKTPMQNMLLRVYSADTVEEWIDENILELQRKLKDVQSKVKDLSKNSHWARRPDLPIKATHNPIGLKKSMSDVKLTSGSVKSIPDVRGQLLKKNNIASISNGNGKVEEKSIGAQMSSDQGQSTKPGVLKEKSGEINAHSSIDLNRPASGGSIPEASFSNHLKASGKLRNFTPLSSKNVTPKVSGSFNDKSGNLGPKASESLRFDGMAKDSNIIDPKYKLREGRGDSSMKGLVRKSTYSDLNGKAAEGKHTIDNIPVKDSFAGDELKPDAVNPHQARGTIFDKTSKLDQNIKTGLGSSFEKKQPMTERKSFDKFNSKKVDQRVHLDTLIDTESGVGKKSFNINRNSASLGVVKDISDNRGLARPESVDRFGQQFKEIAHKVRPVQEEQFLLRKKQVGVHGIQGSKTGPKDLHLYDAADDVDGEFKDDRDISDKE